MGEFISDLFFGFLDFFVEMLPVGTPTFWTNPVGPAAFWRLLDGLDAFVPLKSALAALAFYWTFNIYWMFLSPAARWAKLIER